jgi:hypothetical protein
MDNFHKYNFYKFVLSVFDVWVILSRQSSDITAEISNLDFLLLLRYQVCIFGFRQIFAIKKRGKMVSRFS